MAIKIWVKGPVKAARRGAARAGVRASCKAMKGPNGGRYSVCHAPCSQFPRVQAWIGKASNRAQWNVPGQANNMVRNCPADLSGPKRSKARR